ncbi:MAG TPA: HAD family phosphatase [Verrucomicrobiae bacterium]|nr:HAD family phosphatase [Verrucomicrobiae bacterium]
MPGRPAREPLRAVLFDLDGTLTPPRSSWQYLHERLGLWAGEAERIQERFRAGEISYEDFCRLDAEAWRGLPAARLRALCDEIPYHPGAAGLMASLRRRGVRTGIVSTGLTFLSDRVWRELAMDHAVANEIVEKAGVITGEVVIHVPHGGKDRALARFCGAFGLTPGSVAAVGDSPGDLSMFRAAGLAVAFNATDAAVERGADAVVPGEDLGALVNCLLTDGGNACRDAST